ncbi:MAG: prefoldin subunit beta [Candidatus Altiarchaeota archaeon]|nr:prefoldin subunit beta [Candidatus Altiarchaeota archaeon]
MENLSPQQKHALNQANIYQQQLQIMMSQRQQVELQIKEAEIAVEELEKEKVEHVFKAIGPALVKKKRIEVVNDLKAGASKLETRLKTLQSQEKRLSDKIRELSSKITGKKSE